MKKNTIIKILLIVCLIVLVLDQGTKFLITKYASTGLGTENFGFFITENEGMAFGFTDGTGKNIFLTLIVLLLIITFLKKQQNELDVKTTIAVSLAFGGGLSNLVDRFFRGGVLDFITIWKFPRFNVADICVCIAWFLLIIFLVLYTNKKDIIKGVDPEELKIKEK